jgi:hypothetical protein
VVIIFVKLNQSQAWCIALLIMCLSFPVFAAAKSDGNEDSLLDPSVIYDYAQEIRPHLKASQYVDIVKRFSSGSRIEKERFGNMKSVINLNGLSFSGMNMSRSKLTLADMRGCNLKGADFSNSEMIFVDFEGCDLSGVDFSGADLSHANFQKTTITGAKFKGANLFRADFNDVFSFIKEEVAKLKKRSIIYVQIEREQIKGYYLDH